MEGALQTTLIIADAGHMAILSFIHAVIFSPRGIKIKIKLLHGSQTTCFAKFCEEEEKKAIELWTSS